jgi:restriction modification system DNA specificity domain protein
MRTPQLADNLRRAVLQAAIAGKLNDRTSEDARDLLAAIQTEKAAQQKTGKQKKNKPLAAISEEEIPFAIPENWVWVRLGDVASLSGGYAFKSTDYTSTGVRVIRISDFNNGNFDNKNIVRHPFREDLSSYLINSKDILLCMTGGTVGKNILVNEPPEQLYLNQRVARISAKTLDIKYIFYFINSSIIQDHISRIKNSTNDNISMKDISEFLIPLPPLTEQQQIVAKLNQLLSEIDNLKTQEQALLATQNAFPKKLRAAILQAAIQGELNERTDENARDLLTAIQAEKTALQKTGKLKKDKPLAAIKEEEIPFAIPENWVWVRLGEIGQIVGGGTPKTTHSEYWDNGDIPWITPADMRNLTSKYIERGTRNITKAGLNSSSSQLLPKNSILFSSRAPIGYVAIAQNEMATNQGFKSVAPFKTEMSEYLYFVLLALKPEIEKLGTGTTFKEVSGTTVGNVVIPLPPLTEQQQIVAKLEALLAEIEILENAS